MDHEPHQQQSNPQNLRKSFRKLKNYTSTLANFVLQWQDLEDHFLLIKTQLEHLENTTSISSTQNRESEYTIRDPSTQSEDKSPETKIKDFKTKSFVQSQNENPETENNDNTIEPFKTSSLPLDSGKSLLLYFIEHVREHAVLRNTLFEAFKGISNPAKLVLESLKFFYPFDSSEFDVGIDLNVARKSCVVFLEELNRAGCLVESHERKEAMRMAVEWEAKMKNSLEVLGFLMLVAGFGLTDEFDKDETLKYLENVVRREQAPELFRAFGLADRVHDFIQKLIEKNRRLEAVPFIYEFELIDKFPPVPLLQAHSENAEECYRKICKKGNNSSNALDNAIGTQLAALRGVLTLIKKYKLQSQFSPEIIKSRILQLTKHKSEKKPAKSSPNHRPQQQNGNKHTYSCEAQPNQHDTSKRLRTVVPTSISTLPINAPRSSNPQSYYQEGGLYRSEEKQLFPLPYSGHYNLGSSAYMVNSMAERYGLSSSNPVAHEFASTVGPYGSIASTSFRSYMSLQDSIYHKNGTNVISNELSNTNWQPR